MPTAAAFVRLCAFLASLLFAAGANGAERVTYVHFDALGSPVAATNEQGNIVWRETYQPYGERIRKESTSAGNTRWYTGHPEDPETGLLYAGARYYDPVIGRFMATDPAAVTEKNPHSFNRYAYGNNNPYRYVDPNGEWAIDLNLVVVGGTVGTDAGSGQPFWKFRAGLTGLGINYFPSYDFSPIAQDNAVGDCSTCDARASLSGANISLGLSAGVGVASIEGQAVDWQKEVVTVEHSNGKVSTHVHNRPLRLLVGDAKVGWSGKDKDSGGKMKSRIGIKLSADANAEWGGMLPWSAINPGVAPRRDPKF
jgi:RHS repeat-associated protein